MALRLYNTLTRRKDVFAPIDKDNVRMYVCGPTVYDFAHIGNARPVIVFDVLFRLLRHLYGADHVTYVRNITDVDDKINARAARDYPDLPLNEAIKKVTEETNAQFQDDVEALGCLEPTHQPRATAHITEMITLIERLIARGKAYPAEGHVLFHVPSDPSYGSLARRSTDEMLAGARVDVAPYKRDPMDFVLWKPSTADEPGWDSPWGRGRPGWHIECSAMSWRYLGEHFDIHGGGIDLVFPHHENERAQSCCAFDRAVMANWWMHNGFLQVEGHKMSKSLGNFVTIRDLRENWHGIGWPGEAIRFAMLQSLYREPIDWTFKALDEAHKVLWKWAEAIEDVPPSASIPEPVLDALCDDLNTPKAIAAMHGLFRDRLYAELKAALNAIGISGNRDGLKRNIQARLDATEAQDTFRATIQITSDEIERLKNQRLEARRNKNWAEADRIRDELAAHGIVLKDIRNPQTGEPDTIWELAR
ncbi:cysteine--tRNA ligase [Rhodoligotrophos defluvii]|uniref:cysteine--tRNA ligase n=1 Tax=Rhodoligotrophos defluvii TaxID=2561934 RepID=UPI0010C9E591|nr:cysteine--tRNA ligase [Rhodoligotrophos defluvii]